MTTAPLYLPRVLDGTCGQTPSVIARPGILSNFRIYVNGGYAFTLTNQPSAWAAESAARKYCLATDNINAYPERTECATESQ